MSKLKILKDPQLLHSCGCKSETFGFASQCIVTGPFPLIQIEIDINGGGERFENDGGRG